MNTKNYKYGCELAEGYIYTDWGVGHPLREGTVRYVYLSDKFLQKINAELNNGGILATIIGTSFSGPVARTLIGIGATTWADILWKNDGDGVTLYWGPNTGLLSPHEKVLSGKNFSYHINY